LKKITLFQIYRYARQQKSLKIDEYLMQLRQNLLAYVFRPKCNRKYLHLKVNTKFPRIQRKLLNTEVERQATATGHYALITAYVQHQFKTYGEEINEKIWNFFQCSLVTNQRRKPKHCTLLCSQQTVAYNTNKTFYIVRYDTIDNLHWKKLTGKLAIKSSLPLFCRNF